MPEKGAILMSDEVPPTILDDPQPASAGRRRFRRSSRFSFWGALTSVFVAAVVLATLFTMWTPANLFSNQMFNDLMQAWRTNPTMAAITPTPLPLPTIGIVSGHTGNDSGAVCADGLTEESVNRTIAILVQNKLAAQGYSVDLLNEFDDRLEGYRAQVLVSIHNDSCNYINDEATGFKVAAASSSAYPEKASRLRDCLVDRYKTITGLPFHYNTITADMSSYHTFREIHTETTAAIIETGFLFLDRKKLTEEPDLIADGIVAGILCYMRNEPAEQVQMNP